MPSRPRLRCALALLASACLAACSTPPPPIATEPALVVTSPIGPGLKKPGDQPSDWTVHAGDVLLGAEPLGHAHWEHPVEGKMVRRDGEMIGVRRARAAHAFAVFDADISRSDVVSADWFCEALKKRTWSGQRCEDAIVRLQLPGGGAAGYFTGADAPCPIVIAYANRVERTSVSGISEARLALWSGTTAIVFVGQWLREAGWSGTNLVVIALDPAARRVADIPLVEADPRSARKLRWQMANWEIVDDGIVVSGTRAEVDRTTGERISSTQFREHWGLLPGGRMVRAAD